MNSSLVTDLGLGPEIWLFLTLLGCVTLFFKFSRIWSVRNLDLLLLFALAVLYRFGPNRKPPRWQWLSIGAIVAAVLWIAGSSLLSYYLANFGDYNATYGSLGAVIGLMTWFWMSAIVILVGAELNSEIEHQAVVTQKDHAVPSNL